MTITQNSSAPLFVVVGATGIQGTSVINELRSDSTAYRVRAVTRDPSKDEAKERATWGCEVVAADIDNTADLERVFSGATYVFAMTLAGAKEATQGTNQANAAKKVGVKTFIWASLPSLAGFSNGKYTHAIHWENKAKVATYARSLASADFKVIEVQVGYYVQNFFSFLAPRKQADGTYALLHPLDADIELPVPFIDTGADLGAYVLGAIKNGKIDTVLASPGYSSLQDRVNALSKIAGGRKIILKKAPYQTLFENVKAVRGEVTAKLVTDMIFALAEFGYYNRADLKPSNTILTRPVRSLDEAIFAKEEQFQVVWNQFEDE